MARRAREAGGGWLWLGAGATAGALLLVFGVLGLLAVRGAAHFWPATLWQFELESGAGSSAVLVLGMVAEVERIPRRRFEESRGSAPASGLPDGVEEVERILVRSGNRDLAPPEFVWIESFRVLDRTRPDDAVVVERTEWGDAIGFVAGIEENSVAVALGDDAFVELDARLERARTLRASAEALRAGALRDVAGDLERLRRSAAADPAREANLTQRYRRLETELRETEDRLARDALILRTVDGREHRLSFAQVIDVHRPNRMGFPARLAAAVGAVGDFLTEPPREANTEGGIFPAIFGTVLMVMLMALTVTPFGVLAAIYLHEYAHQGRFTRLLRIFVNNLAGVPAIVYGVFGLGFFVYVLGGSLDELFFPDALPAPTFGTPGLLWASLTLALLTVPVVIVTTEEGLSRIPDTVRDGAYALGATRAETLVRVVLPMASPSILTGVILSVARAAGEVAPLMLVGVVKLAPRLPLDGEFPFLHLDRKFMHLGFHVYDVGFQSPNVEAARPLVFATALLLVAIIVALNLLAIWLRNRLDGTYRAAEG